MTRWPLSKVVEVEWQDAAALGKWRDKKDYETQQPLVCRTAGYLMVNDKKRVIVLQSQSEEGGIADSMTIPKSCVRRIKRLR